MPDSNATKSEYKRGPSRYQYRLRTLLLITTATCVLLTITLALVPEDFLMPMTVFVFVTFAVVVAYAARIVHQAALITIACWNLICFAMMSIYPYTVGYVVSALYTAYFGDIQASYGTYSRMALYVGLAVITTPATLVSLGLCNVLAQKPWSWKRWCVAAVAWQVLLIPILIWSYESGFSYRINQLGWAVFGPPVDLYSFRNLVLHRIVAWLVCTIPISLAVLWGYSRISPADRPKPSTHATTA